MTFKNVAFIPLRSGSKGIPQKNRKKILGRSMFSWVLGEALLSDLDDVFVFTDDNFIKNFIEREYKWSNKIHVLERNPENASDNASTESAMLEFSEVINHNYDIIFLLQATSPLTSKDDINRAIVSISSNDCDSLLSVVRLKRFLWAEKGKSLNYDFKNRPRRQEFDGMLIENGAIYGTKKKILLENKNRLGGNIKLIEMNEETFYEIDEPIDLIVIEELLTQRLKANKSIQKKIKYLVLDVDGIFTEATVVYSEQAEFSKQFNMRDGMGLELLGQYDIIPVIMTSEDSEIVNKRMKKLNIDHVFTGVKDKFTMLRKFLYDQNCDLNEVVYLGDDINDLANICSANWGICPQDAVLEIKRHSDLVLNSYGGKGVIREVVEFLIKYNQRFK